MITDKQTHTPGPWYVVASGICASPTPQSGALYIAWHNVSSSYRDSGEQAANARLIAAAPAMLEALRRSVPWLGKLIADGGHLNSVAPNDAVGAMHQAEAAIAQAEGRVS
jgi:hypothetical protein